MQQLTRVAQIWAAWASLCGASPPAFPAPQEPLEADAEIRKCVDQRYALMSDTWRLDTTRRLAGYLNDPRVVPATRQAVLKEAGALFDSSTALLSDLLRIGADAPLFAPTESSLGKIAGASAEAIDGILKNAARYSPLTPEETAARRVDLKTLEQAALGFVDERIAGDARSRSIVAGKVSELFRDYEKEIGNPTRPFLNLPLPPALLSEALAELEKSFPRGVRLPVAGLTGNAEKDAPLLREQKVEDLIYDVVVRKLYLSVHRASWADPEALKDVIRAEDLVVALFREEEERLFRKSRELQLEDELRKALAGSAKPPSVGRPGPGTSRESPTSAVPKPTPPDTARPVEEGPGRRRGLAVLALLVVAGIVWVLLMKSAASRKPA